MDRLVAVAGCLLGAARRSGGSVRGRLALPPDGCGVARSPAGGETARMARQPLASPPYLARFVPQSTCLPKERLGIHGRARLGDTLSGVEGAGWYSLLLISPKVCLQSRSLQDALSWGQGLGPRRPPSLCAASVKRPTMHRTCVCVMLRWLSRPYARQQRGVALRSPRPTQHRRLRVRLDPMHTTRMHACLSGQGLLQRLVCGQGWVTDFGRWCSSEISRSAREVLCMPLAGRERSLRARPSAPWIRRGAPAISAQGSVCDGASSVLVGGLCVSTVVWRNFHWAAGFLYGHSLETSLPPATSVAQDPSLVQSPILRHKPWPGNRLHM